MTAEEFEYEWERCQGWIIQALHEGGDPLTIDDVRMQIENGEMEFWPAADSAIVTQLVGPARRDLSIFLAGGSLDTLKNMLPTLEDFARHMGCTKVSIQGRLGWSRSFLTTEAGYKAIAIVLGKEL